MVACESVVLLESIVKSFLGPAEKPAFVAKGVLAWYNLKLSTFEVLNVRAGRYLNRRISLTSSVA